MCVCVCVTDQQDPGSLPGSENFDFVTANNVSLFIPVSGRAIKYTSTRGQQKGLSQFKLESLYFVSCNFTAVVKL